MSHVQDEEKLTQLSLQDRVKRSLERLDVPDWYKENRVKDESSMTVPGHHRRKGSYNDGGRNRSTRDRSLPPPSPTPGHQHRANR